MTAKWDDVEAGRSHPDILRFLFDTIGLNHESVGESSVMRAVEHRMKILGCADMVAYKAQLFANENEMAELIEEVVVPETWFFRNGAPFDYLADHVVEKLLEPCRHGTVLRLLSVPCSTGEEPYSMAMSLLERAISDRNFVIDAVDISSRSIARARRGVYSENSFRGTDPAVVERYFRKTASGYELIADVRAAVNFDVVNVLGDGFNPVKKSYDVIFCRNLLIYFDKPTQRLLLKKLSEALADDGVLFLGHAEGAGVPRDMFTAKGWPMSFAYEKAGRKATAVMAPPDENASVLHAARGRFPAAFAAHVNDRNEARDTGDSGRSRVEPVSLKELEALMGDGQFAEALAGTRLYIDACPEHPEAYVLLGRAYYRLGNFRDAETSLLNAIYLDPENRDALGLMAQIYDRQGDQTVADRYRVRATRTDNGCVSGASQL